MRPYLRYLRIAFSLLCGIACVPFIAVWVRNYCVRDTLPDPLFESGNFAIYSTFGVLTAVEAIWVVHEPNPHFHVSFSIPSRYQTHGGTGVAQPPDGSWGFHFKYWHSQSWIVQVPHWFPVVLTGTACLATTLPSLRWSKRFTLHTLFVATTLIALSLGLFAWLTR
jgi:hypothetical protein